MTAAGTAIEGASTIRRAHMDEDTLKRLLKELNEERELKRKRKEHTYVEDLIHLLLSYKGSLSRRMVLDMLERQRKEDGLPIPVTFEKAVQSAYNQNCRDSAVFRKRGLPNSDAPFYSPRRGIWAVDTAHAEKWLQIRQRRRKGDDI